jgi:hypothetical protein
MVEATSGCAERHAKSSDRYIWGSRECGNEWNSGVDGLTVGRWGGNHGGRKDGFGTNWGMSVREHPQRQTPFSHRSRKDFDLCALSYRFTPDRDFSCRGAAPHQRIDWAIPRATFFERIETTVFEAEAARGKTHFSRQQHAYIGQWRLVSRRDARNPEPEKDRGMRPETIGTKGRIQASALCRQSTPAEACREAGRDTGGKKNAGEPQSRSRLR